MTPATDGAAAAAPGRLAENIAHFARALRKAGVPVGTGRVVDAIRAVEAAGFTSRTDFYHTLQACFVSRPEHRAVFSQAFRLFWRDPAFLEQMMSLLLPMVRGANPAPKPDAAERRAAEALADAVERPAGPEGGAVEIDATLTLSAASGCATSTSSRCPPPSWRRRAAPSPGSRCRSGRSRAGGPGSTARGRAPDWRGTMRASLRSGGDVERLVLRARRTRWPALVALCDISGSMSVYSRMLLTFLHAAANARGAGWAEVHAFTFGTRLTNITRHLRHRDVDAALAAAGREAADWDGGTRIGASLHAFNRDWSRRVLSRGAVVLLITDGLDRDDAGQLGARDGAAAALGAPADLAEPAAALGRLRAEGARHPRDAAARRQLPPVPRPRLARGDRRGARRAGAAGLAAGRRSARRSPARAARLMRGCGCTRTRRGTAGWRSGRRSTSSSRSTTRRAGLLVDPGRGGGRRLELPGAGRGGADHGLFCALYPDRGSHSFHTPAAGGPVDRERRPGRPGAGRAGIEHVDAYSPPARGRSERAFSTLADRRPRRWRWPGSPTSTPPTPGCARSTCRRTR